MYNEIIGMLGLISYCVSPDSLLLMIPVSPGSDDAGGKKRQVNESGTHGTLLVCYIHCQVSL